MRNTVNEFDLDVRMQVVAEQPDPETIKQATRRATCAGATCNEETCAPTCQDTCACGPPPKPTMATCARRYCPLQP